jgi:hypothetical protein
MRAHGGRERTQTLKIRPWSQLPGVVGYLVVSADGLEMDRWGEPSAAELERARAFRARAKAGAVDGSHALEATSGKLRTLSVARPDGLFVHVWVEGTTDLAGILSVVGG